MIIRKILHVYTTNNYINLICRKLDTLRRERSIIWTCNVKHYATKAEAVKEHDIPVESIRNFSIIAHVDHGKSTLADRLLEMTGAIKTNSGKQVLDTLQVEKDRGITVKAQTASLSYIYQGNKYLLNLIDTPGHVDFAAEVHRSLAPCQGVILLVDANDGVQAQTVANYHLALEKDLVVIPVINKIDLKNANPEKVINQLEMIFGIKNTSVLKISAKLGTGVDELLKAIVERIPPPPVHRNEAFTALIFDSWFDRYRGSISLIYVTAGSLSIGQHITCLHSKKSYEVKMLSLLRPSEEHVNTLFAGQVGCVACNMNSTKEAYIGDTIHLKNKPAKPLIGFKPLKSMVYAGVFPINQSEFDLLRNAIEKLTLNDNAASAVLDSSAALGQGWRIGFLGLLHLEVFIQRLEQEYNVEVIVTAPSVTYKATIIGNKNIKQYGGEIFSFNNPVHFPPVQIVKEFEEPVVISTIITPSEYIQDVMLLCHEKRGVEKSTKYIDNDRVMLQYLMPLNEIIIDFHDTLKCLTSGYATFDFEDNGYMVSDIIKLSILLNKNPVEELSTIVHRSKATLVAKQLCAKLVDVIPRQLFEIVIQGVVEGKVLARETLKPYRKDVTAKLYGGDVTRRMKLLGKQAEGKKRMKMIGKISIPRDTFLSVLKK